MKKKRKVETGLDKLVKEDFRIIRGQKIGIVANQTSVTCNLTHIIDEAKKRGRCQVEIVFSPEHGFTGEKPEAHKIKGKYYNDEYDIEIFSLYGETYQPPKEILEELDALIFDLQDIGVRWYTYISTLYYCIKACSEAQKPIYILDRPNPLNGEIIEGPILKPEFKSFVGIAEIPVRYGMTIGELALLLNDKYALNAKLQVISMENWKRDYWFEDTNLIWIPTSPNIPTPETAIIYVGTALIEGTNISEGRGTSNPFKVIGAPWIKARKLAEELNRQSLSGVKFRPTYFIPYTSKHKNQVCGGIQVHITDKEDLRPFEIGIHILSTIKKMYPDKFEWIKHVRNEEEKYFIDLLAGTDKLRKMIDENEDPWQILYELEKDLDRYVIEREKYLIYT